MKCYPVIVNTHCYGHAYIVGANDNNDPANWSAQNIFVTPRA